MGGGCYLAPADAANWKGANYACRRLKANLLELDTDDERKLFTSALLSDTKLKGANLYVT